MPSQCQLIDIGAIQVLLLLLLLLLCISLLLST